MLYLTINTRSLGALYLKKSKSVGALDGSRPYKWEKELFTLGHQLIQSPRLVANESCYHLKSDLYEMSLEESVQFLVEMCP